MKQIKISSIEDFFADGRTEEVILVISNQRKEYLLVRKHFYPINFYRFPGGGMEKGEIPLESARRELKEEFGKETGAITNIGKSEVRIRDGRKTINFISHLFLARGIKNVDLASDTEHSEHRWVDIGGLKDVINGITNVVGNFRNNIDSKEWVEFRKIAMEEVYRILISTK